MKILAIGNSFSQDATAYLYQIAAADGFDLTVANLMYGGCSLQQHVEFAQGEKAEYLWEINGTYPNEHITLKDGLLRDDWDIVTIQQASHFSFRYETYAPYLSFLEEYIHTYAPKAKIYVHQTWAYEEGSQRLLDVTPFPTAAKMHEKIVECYAAACKALGDAPYIPSGELFAFALQNGLSTVHRDTFHASIPEGRYLLAALWYMVLTGRSIEGNTYLPEKMDEPSRALCQKILLAFAGQHPVFA